jgi:hypothetical protein
VVLVRRTEVDLAVEKGFLPVEQIKLGMHVVEADRHLGVITRWKVVA